MKTNLVSLTGSNGDTVPQFLDFKGIAQRIPLSERALRDAVRKGTIPSIKLPGGRKRLFLWKDVEAALRRLTTNAAG